MPLDFLPKAPLEFGQPVVFGVLLLAGVIGGEIAQRALSLPRITGYALVGILVGPQMSGLLDAQTLDAARVLVDLSLGLILFELGFRLDIGWLRKNRWLAASALAESVCCFAAIFFALLWFDFSPVLSAMAAAVGTATSPAVVLMVAHELRAAGQMTERVLLFTAVNSVFSFLALTFLLPLLHIENEVTWSTALMHPVYLLAGSLMLGFVACTLLLGLATWIGKREDRQFILIVAFVVASVGLARSLNLPVVVTLLALGIMARNRDQEHALMPLQFGHGGQMFFVLLFVLMGASLEFKALGEAGLATAAFIVARFLGKAVPILAFGTLSGVRPGGAGLLSLALLPMSALAVVMVHDTAALYPAFGAELSAVVLSAVAVLELVGPLATQFALKRSGEVHPASGRI
jgi:Kef-type K+ transport system membrane component KefB